MVIHRVQCWWGAGQKSGEGAAPPPQQRRNCIICIIRRTALSILMPTPSALAVSKSFFFTSYCFSGVRLFDYWFRRLAYGFRNVRTVYNHFPLLIYRARTRSISPCLMICSVHTYGWYQIPIPIVICHARARSVSPSRCFPFT